MQKNHILTPLFKKIDKIFFGFEDVEEIEKEPELINSENDDEFDAVRSSN